MRGDEVVDDLAPELVAQVERDVRDAHAVRERAGAGDRLGRAAALGAIAVGVGPKLECDADDVIARLERKLRRNRRVDATAHSHQSATAKKFAPHTGVKFFRVLRGGPERPVQCVGGE